MHVLSLQDETDVENEEVVIPATKKQKKKVPRKWTKMDVPVGKSPFSPMLLPVAHTRPMAAFECFALFFDAFVFEMIAKFSNQYAQQRNYSLNTNANEIRAFIGVFLLSGYVPLPRRRLYWEEGSDIGNTLVRDTIRRDRFEKIMQYLHLANNMELDKNDLFSKVRPLVVALNQRFLQFAPHEEYHSIDEGMIPYFGRHPGKQFMRLKPNRFGYKVWGDCLPDGFCVQFELYQGKNTTMEQNKEMGLGASVVLHFGNKLVNHLPASYHLVFDNFFTSFPLLEELTRLGCGGTGTIRNNRIADCPVTEVAIIAKQPRGSFDTVKEQSGQISVTRWNDNSPVTIASNCVDANPIQTASRFSRTLRCRSNISQPLCFHLYNQKMGGVDRMDQNMGCYRVSISGKKWWFPIFTFLVDLALQNAWLLHRRSSQGGGKKTMDLLTFRRHVAQYLCGMYGSLPQKSTKSSRTFMPSHSLEIRSDGKDHHLIEYHPRERRCASCKSNTHFFCSRCQLHLHPKCFKEFHLR